MFVGSTPSGLGGRLAGLCLPQVKTCGYSRSAPTGACHGPIRISIFEFLISSFRLGRRYFLWRTASLKVPRCCMIFFCSKMMD
jgi:hypothetical protein